ncbi:hypothetical protein MTR_1199s0010 [Medicago truncatula]|uniref:Uncharacterized protein n=1 Tax=Medicago truncatula TaxID=3880 RepID=A0A072TPC3_MEDTR|nr:hypothetical protein MTR_1199s0010 [Medicago truncatula]
MAANPNSNIETSVEKEDDVMYDAEPISCILPNRLSDGLIGTFVEEIFLITSKAKQRCLYSVHTNRTSPMTGASQFQRRFRENKV